MSVESIADSAERGEEERGEAEADEAGDDEAVSGEAEEAACMDEGDVVEETMGAVPSAVLLSSLAGADNMRLSSSEADTLCV